MRFVRLPARGIEFRVSPRAKVGFLCLAFLACSCASVPPGGANFNYECCVNTVEPAFGTTLSSLAGEPLVGGNRCQLLENGKDIFSSMLEAIRGARQTINMEMYIFQSDATGVRFARAIEERSRAGIHCRVLVDGWGSHNLSKSLEEEMKKAGVEFERFAPVLLFHKFKNRSHRKLLIVDGKIAFLGGEGIDHRWEGDARNPDEWHDAAVRIEGPGVAEFQRVFAENWIHQRRAVPLGEGDYPPLAPVGDEDVMALKSSFGERNSSSALSIGLMLRAAATRLWIENAYFVPDESTLSGLCDASRRGVDVEILLPGKHMNIGIVQLASRGTYIKLLAAGVRIFEYDVTMMHAKTLTVDGLWSTIGSINIDNRSYLLNDEVNATIRGSEFAAKLEEMFRRDRAKSREITLTEWEKRSFTEKGLEGLFGLFDGEL
jgi:cardiolipin synthase